MKPRVLKSQTPEFRKFLAAILARRGGDDSASVDQAVAKIIADVRERGDRALIDLTSKFDSVKLTHGDAARDRRGTSFGNESYPG